MGQNSAPCRGSSTCVSRVQDPWLLVLSVLLFRGPSRETGQGVEHFYFQGVICILTCLPLIGSKRSSLDH